MESSQPLKVQWLRVNQLEADDAECLRNRFLLANYINLIYDY